ncbi:unnamed protein product [Caenorhabditis auriculariae]|uniref:SANTA domain-containing protein n=1 Tax=Caenorhabditis auriculariae TaxID=2777116 RepID=A0A8S1HPQ9_9PELO|nr:unnamed protein product [Caenorhabditis auriculariae]
MASKELVPAWVSGLQNAKCFRIKYWSIKIEGPAIFVEGFEVSDPSTLNRVQSDRIILRINATALLDSHGRVYDLIGNIDRSCPDKRKNTPAALLEKFLEGFPEDWQEIINCYNRLKKWGL